MRLRDKIALVTGSTRGIGLAIVKALAAEGATPVIADINEQGAEEALRSLGETNGLALAVDVADKASIDRLVEAIVERYGRIDILVNNAGIGGNTPCLDITPEEWNRTIAINLTGAEERGKAAARDGLRHGVLLHLDCC
jgi:3-oxoacyl-[acyl-carrier protein] reductase